MRSSVLFTAAFAAVALATPVFDKRGEVVVTDAEVVFVTQVVTVTEGQPAPSAEPTYSKKAYGGWRKGRKGRKTGGYGSAPAAVPTEPAPVPSSAEVPAPAPSTYEPAPQPEPTTEAPAPAPTSYEEPAPAPTSYEQPAPAPTSTQAAPPPAYTPPASGKATTYQQAVVQHHNYHRANHSAPDLAWSQSLADTAMKIAKTCVYEHSMEVDGGGYGQNIAAGVMGQRVSAIISDMFVNGEIAAYGNQYGSNPSMSNFGEWGHLSQILWVGTTEVGCATYSCGSGGLAKAAQTNGYYTVCNYKEPGNMAGAYAKNVLPSLNQPTVDGDYNIDQEAIAKSIGETYQAPNAGYGGYGKH